MGISTRPVVATFACALAGCASQPCCVDFGVDTSPIHGADFVDCGLYEAAAVRIHHPGPSARALKCALRAQSQGRPFQYQWEDVAPPDVHVSNIAILGAHGERLLFQSGDFGDEPVWFAGSCEKLSVLPDGQLETVNCNQPSPVIEALRQSPPARN